MADAERLEVLIKANVASHMRAAFGSADVARDLLLAPADKKSYVEADAAKTFIRKITAETIRGLGVFRVKIHAVVTY